VKSPFVHLHRKFGIFSMGMNVRSTEGPGIKHGLESASVHGSMHVRSMSRAGMKTK
jgi:hypothetical protein